MVTKKQQLISSRAQASSGTNTRKYITIHETANTGRGANAQAHANLQSKGNSRAASWHWQVDSVEAIQSFLHTVRCWHAGSTKGNNESIGIEICVNSDGDFKKAVANAAELVKDIMKQENIPLGNVVQHNKWSGKNCPTNLRNGSKGLNWNDFIQMVKSDSVEQVSKPATPLPTNVLGTVEVLVDSLNVRTAADFNAKVAKTIKRGETYRAYELKNGLYNLGGNQWVSGGNSYVRFVKNPAYKDPAVQAKKEAEKLANEKAKQQQQKDEQHIKKAIEKGIVNGERMNEPLTRRQGTLMIMRALDQK